MGPLKDAGAPQPAGRRRETEGRPEGRAAEAMSLRDLRKARGRTQVEMAEALKLIQENISRIEKRRDVLLSTLRRHVEALGGQLGLVAEFPDRSPVELTGMADPDDDGPALRP